MVRPREIDDSLQFIAVAHWFWSAISFFRLARDWCGVSLRGKLRLMKIRQSSMNEVTVV
jgi:hypothetical protein